MSRHVYAARWVVPVDAPPLERGKLVVSDGVIAGVEDGHSSTPIDTDLGDVILAPGFVNAHAHLDLTGMAGVAPPRLPLPDWLREVVGHRRTRSPEQVRHDIRAGLAEALRTGTTTIGDVSGDGASFGILRDSPMRAVVFRELLGLTEARAEAAKEAWLTWRASVSETPRCKVGVSPHAPYSVRNTLYAWAHALGVPVTTHLAETRDELRLLASHDGVFVPFLQSLGVWDPAGLVRSLAEAAGPGASPTILAHGNYLRRDTALSPAFTVVYCPRTHAAFGHEPHPVAKFLARGTRVALGTDGLASNPDLDMLAEMRQVRKTHPELTAETIVRMATHFGATALGVEEETGSLTRGKSADAVVVTLTAGDPYEAMLAGSARVTRVMCAGAWAGPAAPE